MCHPLSLLARSHLTRFARVTYVTRARMRVAVTVETIMKTLVTVRSSVKEADGGGTGGATLLQGIALATGRATKVDMNTKGLVTREELKEESV